MEKKQNKLVLALVVIAVFISMIVFITASFHYFSVGGLIQVVIVSFEHLAVLYYVLIGYKKPHGNLLRYVMLLFALTIGIDLVIYGKAYSTLNFALPVAEILLIPYIAGRLNKIEQNKILISLVLALLVIDAVSFCIAVKPQPFVNYYGIFGQTIEWFALSAAYFVRYKEHKEAGLIDAPKAR